MFHQQPEKKVPVLLALLKAVTLQIYLHSEWVLSSFPFRDVVSETENDNHLRQINQDSIRVFRSRRHISEDLENEHLEPREADDVSIRHHTLTP